MPAPLFSQKVQARRRRWVWENDDPQHIKHLTCKLKSRHYAQAHGLAAPKLHATLINQADLPDLSDLPGSFVLKPYHGNSSRKVFPIQDGINLFTGEPVTRTTLLERIGKTDWCAYMIEELLLDHSGRPGLPVNYDCYCFGGALALLNVVEKTRLDGRLHTRNTWLTPDWRPLPMQVQKSQPFDPNPPEKPPFYDALINAAETLGAALGVFMRVDMYVTPTGPVFGELTPNPYGGKNFCPEADAWLGQFWSGTDGGRQDHGCDHNRVMIERVHEQTS